MSGVVNLSKGGVVSLKKKAPGLTHVRVGLGWDEAKAHVVENKKGGLLSRLFGSDTTVERPSQTIDCDAFAVLLSNGRLKKSEDLIYFGHKNHYSGAIIHHGDNLVGGSGQRGDDEQISIYLNKVPAEYDEIVLAVNIYQAYSKNQNFGQIENSFIRLVNESNGEELCRYNISDSPEFADKTCVLMGVVKKVNGEWTFKAEGEGYRVRDISQFVSRYN